MNENSDSKIVVKENNLIGHIEFLVLLITLIGGFYLMDGKIERQGSRTDKLYEMWCETQKEIKQIYVDRFKE